MRNTLLLIFITVFQAYADDTYSQNTKLSLNLDNVTVANVLEKIENNSEFYFLFNAKLIDVEREVSVSAQNENILDILATLFSGTGVNYKVFDRQIILMSSDVTSLSEALQQLKITGTVTDKDGTPLPGVNVVVTGTTQGTITDIAGKYSFDIPQGAKSLTFSFIGMESQEISIGTLTMINVTMVESAVGLQEVVVTALGISRDKRQLTYAIQKVDGELLTNTGNILLTKGLQGKIAGVTVRQISGLPGQEAKITIRGNTSITGSNSPLYVVDGSPVDGIAAINPNQVENISVLKGATAAALYGLRASSGVILITTKRGTTNEMNRPTITLSSSYSFDRMAIYPELQTTYMQGAGGVYQTAGSQSYGPKISEMGTYTNQLGEQEVAAAYDNVRNVFQIGGTNETNISISNKFDKGNYSIGAGYSGQKGIVPNTDFRKTSMSIASDYEIYKNITLSTSVNYAAVNQNPNPSNTIFWALLFTPTSYDLKNKPTHVVGNPYQQINFRGQHDNPLWSLENNSYNIQSSSLITSNAINYKPLKWLNLNYRVGYNEGTNNSKTVYGFGSQLGGGRTIPPSGGQVTEGMYRTRSINTNFLATVRQDIGDKLDMEILAGHEFYDYDSKSLSTTGSGFTIPELHHISNCSTITSSQYWGRRRSYALFGNINVNYAKMLNLTVSARNDVVSNMPRDSRSFLYPSVGLGFAFTEAMKIKPDFLDFGRVRLSYAEVGQAGGIYATSTVFAKGSVSRYSFPYNGVNAYTLSSTLKSTNLVPENTKSWETGLNLIFFKNRLNIDYAYYSSISEGQIFAVPVSTATGFSSEVRNAGEMTNHGHEIELGIKPVVFTDFSWDFSTNFSAYVNKVTKLAEGVDELTLGSNSDLAYSVARAGEEYPVIRGYGFVRDEDGKVVVESNPASSIYGMPLRSASADVIFGKANPDFEMNFLNTIKYKNISLFMQIDWRHGGVIASGETRLARVYGTGKDTEDRDQPYVYPDAVKGTYVSGTLVIEGNNDIVIPSRGANYWQVAMDKIWENNVFDASFIRLREVRIDYSLPYDFLSRNNIKGASLFVMGRNLWLIKSGLPYYDPEMSIGSGNAQGLTANTITYPQIASFGFGIDLVF